MAEITDLFSAPKELFEGRWDTLTVILGVVFKVWSLAQQHWHHLGAC